MNPPRLDRGVAMVLQVAIVFVGCIGLGVLLIEPHFEGRNAQATTFQIYFHDPFLAYVYAASIPFFVALGRAFTLFRNVRRIGTFSEASVDALRTIKRCSLAILGFVAGAMVFVLLFGDPEDRPPGVVMCGLAAIGAGCAAVVAATLANRLQAALRRPARNLA